MIRVAFVALGLATTALVWFGLNLARVAIADHNTLQQVVQYLNQAQQRQAAPPTTPK